MKGQTISKLLHEFYNAKDTKGAKEFIKSLSEDELFSYIPWSSDDDPIEEWAEELKTNPFKFIDEDYYSPNEIKYRAQQAELNWLQNECGW